METPSTGVVDKIPIRNIWLLMLYASEFRSIGHASINVEDNPEDIPDLLAEYLIQTVEQRLRQPLTQGYRQQRADLNRVRGRIDILGTESRQLLKRAQVSCHFEELTLNTPRNAYVKAALNKLAGLVQRKHLGLQCRHWSAVMESRGVTASKPDEIIINTERIGRHDSQDKAMLSAAKLVFQLALPTEEEGDRDFVSPERERYWIYSLFEKAVGGFFRLQLPSEWEVQMGKVLRWQTSLQSPRISDILPVMRTDIVLTNSDQKRRIVIDTKFTTILKQGQYREILSSNYLYQMYAYIFSQTGKGNQVLENTSGILLHPAIDEHVDESVMIQGHMIRFMTVNLAGSTKQWKQELLATLQEPKEQFV